MISEIDIYRTAKMLVDRHGHDAPLHAAMRADELLAVGDIDGQRVWMKIINATGELLKIAPTGQAIH